MPNRHPCTPPPVRTHAPNRVLSASLLLALSALLGLPGTRVLAHGTTGNWQGPFDWDAVGSEDCETATHMMALRGGGDTTIVLHLHGTKQVPPCHVASPRVMVIPPGLASPSWGSLATQHVPPPIGEPDLFCCGHAALPDGRMLFIGGTSVRNNGHKGVQVFDPRLCLRGTVTVDGMVFENGWAVVDSMRRERW